MFQVLFAPIIRSTTAAYSHRNPQGLSRPVMGLLYLYIQDIRVYPKYSRLMRNDSHLVFQKKL
jgi:hypothetical protein